MSVHHSSTVPASDLYAGGEEASSASSAISPEPVAAESGYVDHVDEMGSSVEGTGYVLTFVNTMKSNVGLAILAMPFAFNKGGWLAAIVAFAVAATASAYCASRLLAVVRCLADGTEAELADYGGFQDEVSSTSLRSRDAAQNHQEPQRVSSAAPPQRSCPPSSLRLVAAAISEHHTPFLVLVDSLLFVAMAGASIAYVSFLTGSVQEMIRVWGGAEVSRYIIAAAFSTVYTPVAFTKQLAGALTAISSFGVIFLVFGAVAFVSHEGGDCAASAGSTNNNNSTFSPPPPFRPEGIAETVGVAAFSNEGLMALVTPIFAEAHVTKRRGHTYTALVLSVVAICVLMNCTIGLVGSFCERELKPLITSVLPLTDGFTATAVVLLNLQLVCTFPQVTFVALVIAREWLDVVLGREPRGASAAAAGAPTPADALDDDGAEHQHLRRRSSGASRRSSLNIATNTSWTNRVLVPRVLSVAVVWLICMTGGVITSVGGIVALFGGIANTGVTYVVPLALFEYRRIASARAASDAEPEQLRWYARLPRRTWVHLIGIVVATCLGTWASITALVDLVS